MNECMPEQPEDRTLGHVLPNILSNLVFMLARLQRNVLSCKWFARLSTGPEIPRALVPCGSKWPCVRRAEPPALPLRHGRADGHFLKFRQAAEKA